MLPEQEKVLKKASFLDLSKLKIEILASNSIPEEFKNQSENLLTEYRRFLVLKVIFGDTTPPLSLSPSAIIDQMWHLHLLTPLHYIKCCKLLGEEVLDHDPSSSRDGVELRQKRLDMTKRSYKIAFGDTPPEKFWALNYQFSSPRDVSVSQGVKGNKRGYDDAFEKELSENLSENADNDGRKENHSRQIDGEDKLNIRVLIQGLFINVKMRRNTKMEELEKCIEKMGYGRSFRISFNSRRIHPNSTPGCLQMEDGDVIELYQQQCGC